MKHDDPREPVVTLPDPRIEDGRIVVRPFWIEDAPAVQAACDDPDVARSGGEYSTTRDNVALPELKAALFSLPIGQLSGIVTTPLGFYIIKVAERNPAGKIPFDKAEKEIQTLLVNQEVEKRMPVYYEQLKKDFAVQILPRDNAKP